MSKSGTRAAHGCGNIRKRTFTKNGKQYTHWECRVTLGKDPCTGKQIQRTFSGKTQAEVRKKLQETCMEIEDGTYADPSGVTVGEWLDIWSSEYLKNIKPYTLSSYKATIKNHLKPALGKIRLETLNAPTIQQFYNSLLEKKCLSPKTIKNVHGVLHRALGQAVRIGYLRFNPSDVCELPRITKTEITPFDEVQTKAFLNVVQESRLENLFVFTLFTGLRQGEVLGLMWDDVDFENGTIYVHQQLQRSKEKNSVYYFAPLKNNRPRLITVAPSVLKLLHRQHAKQGEQALAIGRQNWEKSGLVFTDERGHHLAIHTVYKEFKRVAALIGRPDARFHDLRHSYAVAAIRSGDDIKTVQANLGHATAAFTLDVYGHATAQMKAESAKRMENYIQSLSNL